MLRVMLLGFNVQPLATSLPERKAATSEEDEEPVDAAAKAASEAAAAAAAAAAALPCSIADDESFKC